MNESRSLPRFHFLRKQALPLIILLMAGITLYMGLERAISSGDQRSARIACEAFIKQRLTDPATAQFEQSELFSLGSDRYQINGYVVGQNRAGALDRMSYRCTVERRLGGMYFVEKLDLQER